MYSKYSCAIKTGNKRTRCFRCKNGVRQGCPLSPNLFNIYINDIVERLNKATTTPLLLKNGSKISCLLYADDIVITSFSEDGLQKCPDELAHFTKMWKLTISMKKTKCITFQKTTKLIKSHSSILTINQSATSQSLHILELTKQLMATLSQH